MNAGAKYPEVKVKLVGEDGNAFAIMGRCRSAVRKSGLPSSVFDEYKDEATSGDYNNLLCATMDFFSCDSDDDDEDNFVNVDDDDSEYALGNPNDEY